jgi:hypothetical protein
VATHTLLKKDDATYATVLWQNNSNEEGEKQEQERNNNLLSKDKQLIQYDQLYEYAHICLSNNRS